MVRKNTKKRTLKRKSYQLRKNSRKNSRKRYKKRSRKRVKKVMVGGMGWGGGRPQLGGAYMNGGNHHDRHLKGGWGH